MKAERVADEKNHVSNLSICRANSKFFSDNIESLKRSHPDQYVAIHNGRVVLANTDYRLLVKELHSKHRDIASLAYIDFVYVTKKRPWIIRPGYLS